MERRGFNPSWKHSVRAASPCTAVHEFGCSFTSMKFVSAHHPEPSCKGDRGERTNETN